MLAGIQSVHASTDYPVLILPDTAKVDTLNQSPSLEFPVDYSAEDSIRLDMEKEKVLLYGNAKVIYGKTELQASFIEYSFGDKLAKAFGVADSSGSIVGKPAFKDGAQSFVSDTILYNFETKKGIIKQTKTQQGEGYVHAETTVKHGNDEIHIKGGKYTTCDHDDPHFYIHLSRAIIKPNDKIVSGPAYLTIGDVPTPLAIPFGFFPNKRGEAAGILLPAYGEDNDGFFLKNLGYYQPLGDKMDMRIMGDIYSRGRWSLRNMGRYVNKYRFNGSYTLTLNNTPQGIDPDFPGYSRRRDYSIVWNHSQDPKAKPNSNFRANVNIRTTTNDQNDFNISNQQYLSNTMQSGITYTNNLVNTPFSLSVQAGHNQNTLNETFSFTLPNVALNMRRIFLPLSFLKKKGIAKKMWYEKIGLNYSMNLQNRLDDAPDSLISFNRFDELTSRLKNGVLHQASMSTSLKAKYFTVNPSFSFSERWYTQTLTQFYNTTDSAIVSDTIRGFDRAATYSMSANLTSRIYGMYTFKKGNVQAIRHVMTPTVGFTYQPNLDETVTGYFGTDQSFTYNPYSLGAFPFSNPRESGRINFGLQNNVEMKMKTRNDTASTTKKIQLLDQLNFTTSYDLFKETFQWSTIGISARTNLFKKLSVNYRGVFDPYAYDIGGNRINRSQYSINKNFGRITSSSVALSISLKSRVQESSDQDDEFVFEPITWTMNVGYNLSYIRSFVNNDIGFLMDSMQFRPHTVNFNGDVNLTSKWKVNYRADYDFINGEFTFANFNFYRDLHCWEMRFNWIPFGFRKSYSIAINVKASILKDLKVERNRSPRNF